MLRRREFTKWVAWSLVGAALPLAGAGGCGNQGLDCSAGDALTTPQRALRASNEYTESSPHGEASNCAGCQFFEAEAPQACGSCQILGGPVNPAGHCNSWAART